MTRLLSDPTVYNNLAANAATIPWAPGAAPGSTASIPDEVCLTSTFSLATRFLIQI